MSEIIKYKDITTIEEYKEYNRKMYNEWYKKNRERKKEYQRNYYYKKKLEKLQSGK